MTDKDYHLAWTRQFFDAMEPFLAKAAYVNYLGGDEGSRGLTAAYSPEKLARLAGLKTKYDPSNLFRMNQNIMPAVTS